MRKLFSFLVLSLLLTITLFISSVLMAAKVESPVDTSVAKQTERADSATKTNAGNDVAAKSVPADPSDPSVFTKERNIFLKTKDGNIIQLTNKKKDDDPILSPDGKLIAFIRETEEKYPDYFIDDNVSDRSSDEAADEGIEGKSSPGPGSNDLGIKGPGTKGPRTQEPEIQEQRIKSSESRGSEPFDGPQSKESEKHEIATDPSNLTQIWIYDIEKKSEKLLVDYKIGKELKPEQQLVEFDNLQFSSDMKFLYFLTEAWVTSSALHRYRFDTNTEEYFTDAIGYFLFDPSGCENKEERDSLKEFQNYIIAIQHRYYALFGGSYEQWNIYTPERQYIGPTNPKFIPCYKKLPE